MAAETEHLTEQIDDILSTWRTDMVAQGADPEHIILKGVNKLMVHQGAVIGDFLAQQLDSKVRAYSRDSALIGGDNNADKFSLNPSVDASSFEAVELDGMMDSITAALQAASGGNGQHEETQGRVKSEEFNEEMDKKVQVTGITSQSHSSGGGGGDWDGVGYKGGIVAV